MERFHLVYSACRLSNFCFCASISQSLAETVYPHTQSHMARALAFEADIRRAFLASGVAKPLETFHGLGFGLDTKTFCCPLVVPIQPNASHSIAEWTLRSVCSELDETLLQAAGFGAVNGTSDMPFQETSKKALEQALFQARGAVESLHLLEAAGFYTSLVKEPEHAKSL